MSEYFGTDAQVALLRRGRALYDLMGDRPGFGYYGRTLGLSQDGPGAVAAVCNLARLQGNANIADIAAPDLPARQKAVEAAGLVPLPYARWDGGDSALDAARAVLAAHSLPDDLTLRWLTPDTPATERAAFAEAALASGVLPPSLAVLSGALKPGLACYAMDGAGRVVSCAASATMLHRDSPEAPGTGWWGMLATRPERRGARLSLILGAEALLAMARRYGMHSFFTGIAPGNAPSEAVCTRMGFSYQGRMILGVADPGLLPGGRMTK